MSELAGYFYNHINKNGYFYIMTYRYSKIVHPSLSKDMKGPMQIKRSEWYSLMLIRLKINCINIKTK